ncbi:MAG: four helix bundle protein [Prevotellaceae bacterium]|jgi:four helix bundle protein|nr:four helix bundle protein [Prevotellaceae bacterium]
MNRKEFGHNFREMLIWQDAIVIAKGTYVLTSRFPESEKYGLSSQMRRAAVSIASNIAEGSGRYSDVEFARFLNIALTSAYELETELMISFEVGYIPEEEYKSFLMKIISEQKKIRQFKKQLSVNVQ